MQFERSNRAPAPAPGPAPRARLGRIESILVEKGVVTLDALAAAKERQRGAKRPLLDVLVEQQSVDEDRLIAVLAEALGVACAPAGDLDPEASVQDLVPADIVQRLGMVPLRVESGTLIVATSDPLQLPAFDELSLRTGLRVLPVLAKPSAIRAATRRSRSGEDVLHDILKHASNAPGDIEVKPAESTARQGPAPVDVGASDTDAPTIRFVNLMISDAIRQAASDVHVEAEKNALKVRFRVDGDLREILSVPAALHAPVVSRIKIISGLDIIETRRPQDGRITVTLDGKRYDLRVSTIPSYFGEKVVMRVLDAAAATFDLNRCGLDAVPLAKWREIIHRPHGLVLMTGPTGSGKTSTLYASLLEVRDPSLNIMTVEDPVEYQFPGIVHVPVRSDIGMTFAAALRSILRQDPDVVLLGEIRDAETAQVALQAAMTGHLVLSTLHTNDAIGAIPRLLDLGVDPQVLASSLLGVMSQRLARTICPSCAAPHVYPPDELRALGWDGAETGTGTRKGQGCRACRNSGSKGRTAVVELVTVTPDLSRLIAQKAPESELLAQSLRDGTVPLVVAGLRKVLAGICTPTEIASVAAKAVEGVSFAAAQSGAPGVPAAPTAPATARSAATQIAPQPTPTPTTARAVPAQPPGESGVVCAHCAETMSEAWKFCPWCSTAAPVAVTGPVAIVCDDDPIARRVAAAALRSEFPRVIEARSGREALDLIAAAPPDILVVDQQMPEMTGLEVIRTLRSRLETASLPILMLTASDSDSIESESLDAGADDYLQKPAQPQRLRTRAKNLVAARKRWSGASDASATVR